MNALRLDTRPGRPPVPEEAVPAVQRALSAEHAAIWTYGLATAFLTGRYQQSAEAYATTHRALRDSVERLLQDSGARPRPAAASYQPPKPVTGSHSAMAAAVAAESDATKAWEAVLENTDDAGLRRTALDALTGAAVRATRWRLAAGEQPAAVALPGHPG